MSEHAWVLENVASYVAGGLDAEEREQLEDHVDGCPECGRILDDARAIDRKLEMLFAPVRPLPELEDLAIQALRRIPERRRTVQVTRLCKLALAAAAAVLLAAVGAWANGLIEQELNGGRTVAENNLKPGGFRPGVDISGGTILLGHSRVRGDMDGDGLRDADTLAKEARERSYTSLIHGHVKHGVNSDPLTVESVDPTAIEPGAGIDYDVDKKAAVSVPGVVDPNEPTGILGGNKTSPPVGMPLPPGLGNKGPITSATEAPAGGPSKGGFYSPDGRGAVSGKGGEGTVTLWGLGYENGTPNYYFKPSQVFSRPTQPGNSPPHADFKGERPPQKQDRSEGMDQPLAGGLREKEKLELHDTRLGAEGQKKPPAQPEQAPQAGRRIIVRIGTMDFEVESFDASAAIILRLVAATKGAFVDTMSSNKLDNGKMCGSVVVRVPPEHLDQLILDLRKELGKAGELKGQRIGSTDFTKLYTDYESELRGARTMEERLLKIIRDGKGEIKDLLNVEKTLGDVRKRMEKLEGEIRYYNNQAALSTLTISLTEKEIRRASAVNESERVQAGIEVEDVDKAFRQALEAILEAKGRVTRSELKQQAAGQFNAILEFEVAYESSGVMRDRLKQLGTMVRLDIDRTQQADSGGQVPRDAKVTRGPTRFFVSIYNLANVAPRETVTLTLVADDVPAAFRKLREVLAKTRSHVVNAQLNEKDRKNISAQLVFDIRRVEEGAVQAGLTEAGEVLSRQVDRAAEGENVTDTKVLFKVALVPTTAVPARQTVTLKLASADVATAYRKLREVLAKVKGRILAGQLHEPDRKDVSAKLDFDIRRTEESTIQAALTEAGEVLSRTVVGTPESENATDTRVLFKVELVPIAAIQPRQTVVLALEVSNVETALALVKAQVQAAGGREEEEQLLAQEQNGKATVRIPFLVPLAAAPNLIEKLKADGQVRVLEPKTNPQAPDGKLAVARISVTLSTADPLVPREDTLTAQVLGGLSWSLRGLAMSVKWLIVGVLFVLPWLLVLIVVYYVVIRRMLPGSAPVPATATAAPVAQASPSGSGTAATGG